MALFTFIGIAAMGISADASTSIPKNFRGYWVAKPTYTWQTKHVKKNMVIPAVKISVHSKAVYWKYQGYLAKQSGTKYDTKMHKLKLVKYAQKEAILKGHGPFRELNILVKYHKQLHLGYQGGGFNFSKVK